jgi:hypothetical protein
MVRKLGLIYRKDKALSKAALSFIQVILEHAGTPAPVLGAAGAGPSHALFPKAVSG